MPNFDDEAVSGVSLFERLKAQQPPRTLLNATEPSAVLRSIKRNLDRILNTRVGDSLSSPQLGLLDFNDSMLTSNDLSQQIQQGIYNCIMQHEPRVKTLKIRPLDHATSPLTLRFAIEIVLEIASVDNKIQLELLLDNNRKYRVL